MRVRRLNGAVVTNSATSERDDPGLGEQIRSVVIGGGE